MDTRPRRATRRSDRSRRVAFGIGGLAVILALFFALRPSPWSSVVNLDSSGTSVIAFGDSLTAGYRVGEGQDFPSRLSSRTGVPIINAGVSGDTTAAALSRLGEDVLSRNPRVVIVGLGGNDYLRGVPIAATESNLRTIVKEIQSDGAMVVLLGFSFPSLTTDYASMYEKVAEEEGCLLIPRVLKGILTKNELKVDTVHPNAKGYEIMTDRLEGPFTTLLRKADAAR